MKIIASSNLIYRYLEYLIIGFISYALLSCTSYTCEGYLKESIRPLGFHGFINKKYINESNRNKPILVISSDNDYIKLPLYDIHKYLYNACSEGDSLIKEVGSTTFTIVKPSGERKEVVLDCRNSGR